MMKKLLMLLSALSLGVAMLALSPVGAAASGSSEDGPELVGTVNGHGVSLMEAPGIGRGPSTFDIHVQLFSNGSARGRVYCVDVAGDPTGSGIIFGQATSWTRDATGAVTLIVPTGTFTTVTGVILNTNTYFTTTIQRFGGAGVGHWSMNFNHKPFPFCWESVTQGHINGKGEIFRQRDDE
jgi:hypothetical protein